MTDVRASSPLVVARIGGLPVSAVEALSSPHLVAALERMFTREHANTPVREHMSAALFETIGAATTVAERNRLLEVRRSLYNGRILNEARLTSALSTLPQHVAAIVRDYDVYLRTRQDWAAQIEELYTAELVRTRTVLQRAVNDPDFQKGVLVSAPSLFGNIPRYQRADPGAPGSRSEQIERGLLRYFTRAAMKATPYATFCSVIPGEFVDTTGTGVWLAGDATRKRGYVRLNKALYGLLWRHVRRRPRLRRRLRLELNPTVQVGEQALRFLASVEGKEVFQQLGRNDAVELVVECVRRLPGTLHGVLIATLLANPRLETTEREAESFLESLIAIGLLRIQPVVTEQEADWDVPLREHLQHSTDEHGALICELLGELRRLVNAYAAGDVAERERLLSEMRERVSTGLDALGVTGAVREDVVLFEDASLDAVMCVTKRPDLRHTLGVLARIGLALLDLSESRDEQMIMRRFFEARYDGRRVGLVQFSEDLGRAKAEGVPGLAYVGRDRRVSRDTKQSNGLDHETQLFIRGLETASAYVTTAIEKRWGESPTAEELNLPVTVFEEAVRLAPANRRSFVSMAFFCQLLYDDRLEGARCVLAHPCSVTGFGKFFSRFLYMLPPSVTERLREHNDSLTRDILAEIAGDADFNGNLHPPLVECEISHPSGEGSSAATPIAATDIDVVAPDEDPYRLHLVQRSSRRRIHPLDLGFQNTPQRSPLYQLLASFCPGPNAVLRLPPRSETAGLKVGSNTAVVVYRPRIVVDGRVVIARRRWLIPSPLFPQTKPSESGADFFVRVNRWRQDHGIPWRAYARILRPQRVHSSDALSESADGKAARHATRAGSAEHEGDENVEGEMPSSAQQAGSASKRHSRDYFKPQFVDFGSPLLVLLFARLTAGLDEFTVAIEECYPSIDGLPRAASERFTTELILQIDCVQPSAADAKLEDVTEEVVPV
jgi:hypothetical protein